LLYLIWLIYQYYYIFALNIKTHKAMNKSTKKYKKFNSQVINKLSEKYSLTGYYIRQCLKGERNSVTSDKLCREYIQLVKQVENVLNQ